MKAVYTVSGSNDGILGVYTNVKSAYEKCVDYIQQSCEVKTTYREALKGCKSWGCYIESNDYYTSAMIQVFYLNQ